MKETIPDFENKEIFDFDDFLSNNQFPNLVIMDRFLKDIYRELSTNKEGVSIEIFREFINLPSFIADKIFKVLDCDKDNYLNSSEFLKGMREFYNGDFQKLTKFIFDIYDFDKDGKLFYDDVKQIQMLILPSQHHNDEVFKCINDSLDSFFIENKKEINFDDFVKITENINSDIFMNLLIYLYFNKPFTSEILFYYNSDKRIKNHLYSKNIEIENRQKSFSGSEITERAVQEDILFLGNILKRRKRSYDSSKTINDLNDPLITDIKLKNNSNILDADKIDQQRSPNKILKLQVIEENDIISINEDFTSTIPSNNNFFKINIMMNNKNNLTNLFNDGEENKNISIPLDSKITFNNDNMLIANETKNNKKKPIRAYRSLRFPANQNNLKCLLLKDNEHIGNVDTILKKNFSYIAKNIIKTPKNKLFLKKLSERYFARRVTYTDGENEEEQNEIKEEPYYENYYNNYLSNDEIDVFEEPAEEYISTEHKIQIPLVPSIKNLFDFYRKKMSRKNEKAENYTSGKVDSLNSIIKTDKDLVIKQFLNFIIYLKLYSKL